MLYLLFFTFASFVLAHSFLLRRDIVVAVLQRAAGPGIEHLQVKLSRRRGWPGLGIGIGIVADIQTPFQCRNRVSGCGRLAVIGRR